ncbi:hypothetical protein [Pimelobacter simplex]|uniref:hypothetical protein n=1 Tax=Nocardioides simplex TaxID=2045 RepID=UPI001932B154|nr:hypothetical protein [Pimelobacter simplex]
MTNSRPHRAAALLLATLLTPTLGACTGETDRPDGVPAATLPEDLCAAVPADLRTAWQLTDSAHETSVDETVTTATCTLAGSYLGAPVTVDLSLTSLAGTSTRDARDAMATRLAAGCDDLADAASDAPPGVTFDRADSGCTLRRPGGDVVQVARSVPAHGVARVEVTHDGDNASGVAAEAERLVGVLTGDPDELTP